MSVDRVSDPEQKIWDPGKANSMYEYYDTYALSLSENLVRLVTMEKISDVANNNTHGEEDFRNEIEYHANILLVGRHAHLF